MRRFAAPAALAVLAVALSWSHWTGAVQWTPDGLFYESQARELVGTPAQQARHDVFFGALGRSVADPAHRLQDPRWIAFAARFYRRRWVVPALSDVLRPLFGVRSLLIVSLLAYVASGLLAYALARRRFGVAASAAAGAFTLWYPPLRSWAAFPLTDSSGVAALLLALLACERALHGPRRRVAVWTAAVLLVAFTRDTAVIAAAAGLAVAAVHRTRRAAAIGAAGVLAALPAPLLFGAPLRATLAFTFSGNQVPVVDTWHSVLHAYPTFVRWMFETDFPFASSMRVDAVLVGLVALLAVKPSGEAPLRRVWTAAFVVTAGFVAVAAVLVSPLQLATFADPVPAGVLLIGAVLPLFLTPRSRDPFLALLRGGALASVAYLFLLPQYTALRLALVVLPFAALGVARAVELARAAAPQRGVNEAVSIPKYVGAS
ncbi:MAG TPA: hypothetical protein VFA05_04035 [Gaiellaceae bacterium]|nr:hypothetical protein [Gaiellaceae bacterium]